MATQIQKTAYERYQLDWMMNQGYSLQDVLNICREGAVGMAMDGILDSDMNVACDSIEEYYNEQGFNGNMYVCFEEFLGAEYKDKDYIASILTKEEYEEYCKEEGISDSVNKPYIEVQTPLGTIRATDVCYDDFPGIEVGLYENGVINQGVLFEYSSTEKQLRAVIYRPEDPFGDIFDKDIIPMSISASK